MTKKGYQKRLPKVLPAAAPKPKPLALAPRVPAPRSSPEELPVAAPPTSAAVPAPRRGRRGVGAVVAACLTGVAAFAAGLFLVPNVLGNGGEHPAGSGAASTDATTSPPAPVPGESYVETLVGADGDLAVRQWIRFAQPVDRLRLALPAVPGAAADRIVVTADGRASGPQRLSAGVATYTFGPTTDLRVSYRMTGVVTRSDPVAARALVLATSLVVRHPPRVRSETRAVRAAEVLSLACAPTPTTPPEPCGAAVSPDRWQVELTGTGVDDRVVAQVDLR
jgi:hypothetical protein